MGKVWYQGKVKSMKGSRDLNYLLKNMKPKHVKGEYIFAPISRETFEALEIKPLLVFQEKEAVTVVVTREDAEKNSLTYDDVWGLVTLSVDSDLAAVGFLAAVTNVLSMAGISTNVVSAFYHDHLFVPIERIQDTISLLTQLSKSTPVR